MPNDPTCRTCDGGRLHLLPLHRHGEIAAFFGTALVVVSIASLVIWVFGLCDALANRNLNHDYGFLIVFGSWLVASLLIGIVGAVVRQRDAVLACSNCGAVSRAMRLDEIELWSSAGSSSAAPSQSSAGTTDVVQHPSSQ